VADDQQPQEEQPREYVSGDEVKIRLAITSASHIHSIEVIYSHPDYPWITLILEGTAELEEGSRTSGPRKRFVATVSGVMESHHALGVYEVARVLFYTFDGTIIYDRAEEGYTICR
jgi:hypothetical protein